MGSTAATFAPPVGVARRWMAARKAVEPELINLSQAAPTEAPPEALIAEMQRILVEEPEAHRYGPCLGWPPLREGLAVRWQRQLGGSVQADQIAITAGCNQAFAASLAALCSPGDAVLLPEPYYFNHKMLLDMAGVTAIPVPLDAAMRPMVAEVRLPARCKALVVVNPNNPTGAILDADCLRGLYQWARSHDLKLILDVTYLEFGTDGPVTHDLFSDPDWDDTLIQLYSFSKSYRLTGHRVGAIAASPAFLAEAEKYLDSVAVCAPGLGQRACAFAMTHLEDWLGEERARIAARGETLREVMRPLANQGWQLQTSGAYFGWLRHPWPEQSDEAVALDLMERAGLMMLPGSMFMTNAPKTGMLRMSFANASPDQLAEAAMRLRGNNTGR